MHTRRLIKPDGRALLLYARAPLAGALEAPSPPRTRVAPSSARDDVAYAFPFENRGVEVGVTLAGSGLGAGVFTAGTLPEEKAAELRAIEVELG